MSSQVIFTETDRRKKDWDQVGKADFKMAEVGGEGIVGKVCNILAPLGLELYPFKVRKYLKTPLMIIRPLVEVKRQCYGCLFFWETK